MSAARTSEALRRARRIFGRVALLFAASYGLFYYAYVNGIPWNGTGDWLQYYPMYLSPLNLHAADSPFVLRQVSAVLTHLVVLAHVYYPSEIRFVDPDYEQRVYFAALLVNWVCLVLAAAVAGSITEEIAGRRDSLVAALAGLLCLLSFHSQYVVIAGITEGMNWLLVALGFLAYLRRAQGWLAAVLTLAIFQRETIPIAFFCFAGFDLLRREADARFRVRVLAYAAGCFAVYFWLRKLIPGREFQTRAGSLLVNLVHPHLDRGLIFQGVLTQNIALIALAACLLTGVRTATRTRWLPMVLVTLAVLDLVGFAAAIGNNVGRIGAILTPVFAALAAAELARLAKREETQASAAGA